MNRAGLAIACPLALLTCGLLGVYASLYPLNHDAAYFLQVAERVWRGERLYADFINNHLPFITWYSLLPVALAGPLGLPIPTAFLICVSALMTASVLLCLFILSRDAVLGRKARMAGAALLLPLILLYFPCVNSGSDFGQREHLFMGFAFPYFLLALTDLRGVPATRRIRVTVGLFALLGFVIKPHFILLFAASELYRLRHDGRRSWQRADALIIGIGFVLSQGAAMLAYPQYLAETVRLAPIYLAYNYPPGEFFPLAFGQLFIVLSFAFMLLWLVWRIEAVRRELFYLFTLLGAGVVLYLVQMAPYLYKALPACLIFWFLCGYLFLHVEQQKHSRYFLALVLAGFMLLLKPMLGIETFAALRDDSAQRQAVAREMHARFAGKSAVFYSTSMLPGFPAMNDAGMLDQASLSLLMFIPRFYRSDELTEQTQAHYHRPDDMPELERHYYDLTIDDLIRRKPQVIMVRTGPDKQRLEFLDFDFLDYLKQDARFAAAFAAYRQVSSPYEDMALYEKVPN